MRKRLAAALALTLLAACNGDTDSVTSNDPLPSSTNPAQVSPSSTNPAQALPPSANPAQASSLFDEPLGLERQPLLWEDGSVAPKDQFAAGVGEGRGGVQGLHWFLSIMWPLQGTPGIDAFEYTYVRDTDRAWEGRTSGSWSRVDRVPNDATDTGVRTVEGLEVWAAATDPPQEIYLVGTDTVEQWPQLIIFCA